MNELARKSCVPCKGGTPPLDAAAIAPLARQLPRWAVIRQHHLERWYRFVDFRTALAFVDRVGEIAESERHHPDVHLAWGKVGVEIWTHKIDGLTESDFVMAAKIEEAAASAAGMR